LKTKNNSVQQTHLDPVSKKAKSALPQSVRLTSNERSDLISLLLIIVTVVLTWFILGWKPNLSIMGHDAWATTLPGLRDLMETFHGDWTKFIYRPNVLGGSYAHDVYGTPALWQLCGWLGTLNCTAIFIQVFFAFFGIRVLRDLLSIWRGAAKPAPLSILEQILLTWVMAFSPMMGWKVTSGHFIILLGVFVFLSTSSLVVALLNRSLTWVLLLSVVAALSSAIPTAGQQTIVYSVVFGMPIILGFILSDKKALPWLIGTKETRLALCASLLALFAGIALSLPKFAGLLRLATGPDSPRGLGGESVIYSYVTATLKDWITSIPWAYEVFPIGQEFSLHHEVNYPFGPLLLLLMIVPFQIQKSRGLAIGMWVSAFLAIAFSMDFHPVSGLLPLIVPPLKSFRVPERAIMSFLAALPSRTTSEDSVTNWITACIVGAIAATLPPAAREALLWCAVIGFTLFLLKDRIHLVSKFFPALLALIAVSSLISFQERLLPMSDEANLLVNLDAIRAKVVQSVPSAIGSLDRVHLAFQSPETSVNSGYAAGLSTLEGYWQPPKRFIQMFDALNGSPYISTSVFFAFQTESPAYKTLKQLYNSRAVMEYANGDIRSGGIENTAGPAWFSSELEDATSIEALATTLKAAGDTLSALAHQKAWLIHSDPDVQRVNVPATINPLCSGSTVDRVEAPYGSQQIRLYVTAKADCPLTVATNYVSAMQESHGYKVFPIYGSLTGVWVPANASEVTIEVTAAHPTWAIVGYYLGIASLLAALCLAFRLARQNIA
jgi:hypothetical protein